MRVHVAELRVSSPTKRLGELKSDRVESQNPEPAPHFESDG